MNDDRPVPRPGQVWYNWNTGTTAVVCGRMLPKGCRVLLLPDGYRPTRYSRWLKAPRDYDLIKEPK